MNTIMKFEDTLDVFQNIVTLYRNEEGKLFIGSTFYYNGRGNADDWMSVLYKDAMPEEEGLLMGWNKLDDCSPNIFLVPEADAGTGVEDFLYAHGLERNWKSVEYHVVNSFMDMDAWCGKNRIEKGTAVAFGIRRK